MDIYKVIGLMSGTSLDGVDLAYCEFRFDQSWEYKIHNVETIAYPHSWKSKLTHLMKSSKDIIEETHVEYGKYLGLLVDNFIKSNKLAPTFIASHGHTIFHQPEKKYTLQIGDGQFISDVVKLPVVFDFRTLDVQLGGQGAPLVPIGDRLLFGNYAYCLNFGGIANISYESKGKRIAFDICPVNMVLNHYTQKIGLEYDNKGKIAQTGKLNNKLLKMLNKLDFYSLCPPKSLGREWVENNVIPLIDTYNLKTIDVLRTYTEHIVNQIARIINEQESGKILVTGGGAKNTFLIELLKKATDSEIVIPDETLIDYKEAMIFAFLGVLRWRNEINCLSSVTGALRDSTTGSIAEKY